MKKLFLFGSAIFMAQILFAQAPNIMRQATFGGSDTELGHGILATADGGYMVYGETWDKDGFPCDGHGSTNSDGYCVKVDAAGNLQWQNCYGGSGGDLFSSMVQLEDSSYMVVGYAGSSDGDVSGFLGGGDVWVLHLSTDGAIIWQKCYGGSGHDFGVDIELTNNGNFIIAGYTGSNDDDVQGNHGITDAWLFKIGSNGHLRWQTCIGGSDEDIASSIVKDGEGNFVFTGHTYSNDGDITGNHGYVDVLLGKVDANGALIYTKCFGGSAMDDGNDVKVKDGNIYVCGDTYSSDGDFTQAAGGGDAFVLATDESGNLLWTSVAGNDVALENFKSVLPLNGMILCGGDCTKSGGMVKGNNGYDDYWICLFNQNGKLIWQQCYGGSDIDLFAELTQLSNGTVTAGGTSYSSNGDVAVHYGSGDVWVITLDTTLSPQVFNQYGKKANPGNNPTYICFLDTFDVDYKIDGDFAADNIFKVEASPDSDNFSNPIALDSVQSNTAGTIAVHVPFSLTKDVNYRIRITASDPPDISNINPNPIIFGCERPGNAIVASKTDTSALLSWHGVDCDASYLVSYKNTDLGGPDIYVNTSDTFVNLTGLQPFSHYRWDVATVCSYGDTSAWRFKWFQFKTPPGRTGQWSSDDNTLSLLANPATTSTTISYTLTTSSTIMLELIDVNGHVQTLLNETTAAGSHQYVLNTQALSAGMYLVRLTTDDGSYLKKLVVQ